jgi:hypothetical protein
MAENKNYYKVDGVVYAKPVQSGTSKKTGKPYSIPSIILEIKTRYKDKEYTTLPEFMLSNGVSVEGFEIGDMVTISFALDGKKIGDWHKTSARATYIKFADIDAGGNPHTGKVKADEVFQPPVPVEEQGEIFEDDGLPF